MTLDEAIKHCEEVAGEKESEAQDLEYSKLGWRYEADKCSECANDHRQLAAWLRELKAYKEQEPCEDAISRKAVDALVDELARAISDERLCIPRGRSTGEIMQDILDLPSVIPRLKTGKWITFEDYRSNGDAYYKRRCSNCGECSDYPYNFCPQCGERKEWCDE